MKKILIKSFVVALLLSSASCSKDFGSLNDNIKSAENVPSYTLFSNAQRNMVDYMTSSNVNTNIFRLLAQQWTEVTYVDESNYDLGTRTIPDNFWRDFYKNVLINFKAAKTLIPTDVIDMDVQKNEIAITDLMQVYGYSVMVETFGNIPYTQALDPEQLFPKYDDAKTIFEDLLTRIDADIAALNTASSSFGTADLIYSGDVAKWKKFAYSLKLKMGMLIADSDPAKAKTIVEAAAANAFSANSDNAVFKYLATTPNTNPIWVDLVQSGRNDFVACNTIVDKMNSLSDPRLPLYFTQYNGAYVGGISGVGNIFTKFSHPTDAIEAPDAPSTLLSYSEIEFLLAEAVERGMNVGGTAQSHYDNAVTASILEWGGTAADALTYLATSMVNYSTASGTYKDKIGNQKYLSLYNRGFDAWTEIRRLDAPVIVAPATAISGFPVRFSYPSKEQNLNKANYQNAASAIGGDLVTTKLWFDKY